MNRWLQSSDFWSLGIINTRDAKVHGAQKVGTFYYQTEHCGRTVGVQCLL